MNGQPPEQVRLRDLPNIGPASERMLAAAGIETPEELEQLRREFTSGGR